MKINYKLSLLIMLFGALVISSNYVYAQGLRNDTLYFCEEYKDSKEIGNVRTPGAHTIDARVRHCNEPPKRDPYQADHDQRDSAADETLHVYVLPVRKCNRSTIPSADHLAILERSSIRLSVES